MLQTSLKQKEKEVAYKTNFYGGELFVHDYNSEGKCSCGYTHPIGEDGKVWLSSAKFPDGPESRGPRGVGLKEIMDIETGRCWVEADPIWSLRREKRNGPERHHPRTTR